MPSAQIVVPSSTLNFLEWGSSLSERNEIRRDGARAQKNSGRGKIQKGDAIWNERYLVDYKEYAKSITLNRDVWGKVCTDAMKAGRSLSPILKIILGEGKQKTRLAVIEWSVLEQLVESEREYDRIYPLYLKALDNSDDF